MPKVSALMPVYNSNLAYLKDTIESVLNQSFADFEFLILNDSPQNLELESFILEYAKKDKRIKYFKNERNLGISPSRNKLVELAQGEFLAVIDHDDISVKERFEKQVAFLDENSDIGVVSAFCTNDKSEEEMGKGELWWFRGNKDDEIKIALMLGSALSHPAAMIRAEVLRQSGVRYNAFYTPAEDYKLWCDLIAYTNFANLSEVLLYHRDYNNTTYNELDKQQKRHWAIVDENKRKYPELFNIATRDNLFSSERERVKRVCILGLQVLKIIDKPNVLKYKLFGKITILKILKSQSKKDKK